MWTLKYNVGMKYMRTQCRFISDIDKSAHKDPYVDEVYSYDIKEGFIEFNGYFRVKDNEFPLIYQLCLSQEDTSWNTLSCECYLVEIYKREIIEDTSIITEIDEDGEPMHICFCPTERMRLWFRVIEK